MVCNNTEIKPRVSDQPIWDILMGLVGYRSVLVSYELGIFETLLNKKKSLSDLSVELDIKMRPLEALMHTNAALNLVKNNEEKYELTELSEDYLIKDSPTSLGGVLDSFLENSFNLSIDSLKEAVLTDRPQTYAEGDVFASHEEQAEQAKAFTLAMHSISVAPATYWPDLFDFSGVKTFLDIGGGSGAHTISVLHRWANLSGIVFDVKNVCDVAQGFIDKNSLANRASVHAGDIWDSPYPKADIHFYSQIFHDWPLEKCKFLAQKSYESLPKGGKIVLHEKLLNNEKNGPFAVTAASIAMLLWTEGRQYSGKELEDLLKQVGFRNILVQQSFGYFSVISGEK